MFTLRRKDISIFVPLSAMRERERERVKERERETGTRAAFALTFTFEIVLSLSLSSCDRADRISESQVCSGLSLQKRLSDASYMFYALFVERTVSRVDFGNYAIPAVLEIKDQLRSTLKRYPECRAEEESKGVTIPSSRFTRASPSNYKPFLTFTSYFFASLVILAITQLYY